MKKVKVIQTTWLETTKEFHRWKKTPQFEKWRKKQFLKQGGLCWYCQEWLPLTKQNVEHKTARSRGGRNNKNNLVLACSACNKEKGSKVLTVEQRAQYNRLNKNHKGTYLKNKQHFDNLYTPYSDENLHDLFSNL